jgi:hypothetical protein
MEPKKTDINLFVIIGRDNFDHDTYIKDVWLSLEEANLAIRHIKPNGTLADTFHVHPCSLLELQNNPSGVKPFDAIDVSSILRIYKDLNSKEGERLLSIKSSEDLLNIYDSMEKNDTSYDGVKLTKDDVRKYVLNRMV